MKEIADFNQFLEKSVDSKFYATFLEQIEKDFMRAGLALSLSVDKSPKELKSDIQSLIEDFLLKENQSLATLFYLIDIPEKLLVQSLAAEMANPAEAITLLILKREWQKVWTRLHYS